MGAGLAISSMPAAGGGEAAHRVFKIMDQRSLCDVREQASKIPEVPLGKIEFKDITFKYPSRRQKVLRFLDLKIEAGQKIGLVGHSGCGKSTIANLLLRFYGFQSGELLIDGAPILDYDVLELRKEIGYVMQEPVLFNLTIKENILYG